MCFIYKDGRTPLLSGFASFRVRVSNFQTRYKIPIGFGIVPVPVPAGTNTDPNPRPAGRVSADLRVFCTRCHLYTKVYKYNVKVVKKRLKGYLD